MLNILVDDLYISQKIELKKKYSNRELLLFKFFYAKTRIHPENIIICNDMIFFFVKKKDYFKAKVFQPALRMEVKTMKVIIISTETTLIKQIFSFFPDTYIHDIKLSMGEKNEFCVISLLFLSFKERGIAIGIGGGYIDAINEILQKHTIMKGKVFKNIKLKIQCKLPNINYQGTSFSPSM